MICSKCKSGNVSIIDSRPPDAEYRRRKYQCNSCGRRFFTIETYEEGTTRHTEQIVDYIINESGELDYCDNHGELIRCRECQRWNVGENDEGDYSYCDYMTRNVQPDDYCSRALKIQ